jgi:hypothetical protein
MCPGATSRPPSGDSDTAATSWPAWRVAGSLAWKAVAGEVISIRARPVSLSAATSLRAVPSGRLRIDSRAMPRDVRARDGVMTSAGALGVPTRTILCLVLFPSWGQNSEK